MSKYLLLFCFVGFSLGQLGRITLADGVAVTLLDIAVFFFVSYSLIRASREKRKYSAKLLWPIGLFAAACIISLAVNFFLLTSDQFAVALLYLVRWLLYAGVYLSIVLYKSLKEKELVIYLLGAGIVHLLIGAVQYFFYPDLRKLYHLGWDDHLYRLVGGLIDPNYQGALFVLLFILLFIIIIDWIRRYKSREFVISAFLLLITIIEIVLTYSRSSLVMLGTGLATLFLFLGNKKLILLSSGCVVLFIIIFSNTFIEGLNPFRTASISARFSSMREAVTIIKDNSVFGVGFNAYRYAQHRYGFRESERWQTSHADAGTDNSFLFVFATTGIVGLLAYVYLLRNMLQLARSKIKKTAILPLTAFVSITALIVDSFFVNSLFYTFFMFWIWVLVGFTENR
jgi:hypothetical protein